MGAGGSTAVAIVFAGILGAVVIWTGIYFVYKWTGRRGRQVGTTRGNYGRGRDCSPSLAPSSLISAILS